MEAVMTVSELRTSDLALATYLHHEGHEHDRMELMDGDKAVWVFRGGPELHDCAGAYAAGDAVIEPKAFTRKLREVRDGLYTFLRTNR